MVKYIFQLIFFAFFLEKKGAHTNGTYTEDSYIGLPSASPREGDVTYNYGYSDNRRKMNNDIDDLVSEDFIFEN